MGRSGVVVGGERGHGESGDDLLGAGFYDVFGRVDQVVAQGADHLYTVQAVSFVVFTSC